MRDVVADGRRKVGREAVNARGDISERTRGALDDGYSRLLREGRVGTGNENVCSRERRWSCRGTTSSTGGKSYTDKSAESTHLQPSQIAYTRISLSETKTDRQISVSGWLGAILSSKTQLVLRSFD